MRFKTGISRIRLLINSIRMSMGAVAGFGLRLFLVVLAIGFVAATSSACQVPVFRYALERWPADRYQVLVLHQADLSAAETLLLDRLRQSGHVDSGIANFDVRSISVDETEDRYLLDLWQREQDKGHPLMVVLYPRNTRDVPDRLVSVARLTSQSVTNLIDSPVRQQVIQHLLDGDSAVWIFIPSGHAEQDSSALEKLRQQAKLNQDRLELPPQEELESDEFFVADTEIELRIGFAVVTVDRDDPAEQFLLQFLLGSEADLESLQEPMAFPVLGRGRVLYGLVGKGIAADMIGIASRFIVGPCSCQVKEQNPGFDLLLSVDWEKRIGSTKLSKDVPERTGKPVLLSIPPGKSSSDGR